jgi:hypothetical protein
MQKQDQDYSRIAASFLVAPSIPALVGAISVGVSLWPGTWAGFIALVMVFFIAYAIAFAHTFILGIPAFLLGIKFHAIYWWSCILVGFVIGSLPLSLWMQGTWQVFLAWGFFGAMGGFAFWLLWRFWARENLQVAT